MISIKINENDNNNNISNQRNLNKIPLLQISNYTFFLENVHSAKIINMISKKKIKIMIKKPRKTSD